MTTVAGIAGNMVPDSPWTTPVCSDATNTLGDGCLATSARITYMPLGLVLDAFDNIYITSLDQYGPDGGHRVRKVTTWLLIPTFTKSASQTIMGGTASIALSGTIAAGTVLPHNTETITITINSVPMAVPIIGGSFALNNPSGVAEDPAGNIYIADTGNCRIRMISVSGTIQTVVGNGTCSSTGDGGSTWSASTNHPRAIYADGLGNVYFAEGARVRVFNLNGNQYISTYAGGGTDSASDNILATNAQLAGITAITVDRFGNLYMVLGSAGGNKVRKVDSHGYITTVPAGTLLNPVGVAVDQAGFVFISDAGNYDVVRVDLSGNASVVAGQPGMVGSGCGPSGVWSTKMSLGPVGPVITDAGGNVYILNTNSTNSYVCQISFALNASGHTIIFPDTTPGTTVTGSVNPVVYNNGTLDTTLSTVAFTGNSAFSQNSINTPSGQTTCANGTALPVGGSCYLSPQFTAPAVRQSAYTATLTLTDGAYTSPQAISLSGISIGAENKLGFPNAPYTVTFGGGLPTVNVQVQDSLGNLVPTADLPDILYQVDS